MRTQHSLGAARSGAREAQVEPRGGFPGRSTARPRRHVTRARLTAALVAPALALAASTSPHAPAWLGVGEASAQTPPEPTPPLEPREPRARDVPSPPRAASPFDKKLGGSGYAVAVTGSYSGVGVGGRLRWEMFRFFGIELFGEGVLVESRAGVRHDYPVGFHLFSPFRLGERVRLRPLAGMCASFSFVEPSTPGGVRADDVLFGVHGGVGLEVALASFLSAFADVKGTTYLGHARTAQGYTGDVGERLEPYVLAQGSLGLSLHL